jgi:microcin C transport system permease protein
MIVEKYIKNDLTLKRWRIFKSKKAAAISCWVLFAACFFSFTAEFWANSEPIYLSYSGKSYYPVFKTYAASDFNITDTITVDYRSLELEADDYMIWPVIQWNPYESNRDIEQYPGPPTTTNLFGTDDRGRDVLVRLLYGLRYNIIYSVFVWILTFIIGTIVGGSMGYFGGRYDFYGQRFIEILSTVPYLLLLIILISIFKPSLALLIIISCVFGWIGISYYVRGEFLKNRKKEYVEAARGLGAGHFRIFFKHILPNSLTPLITFSPFTIAAGISALAALDYLGFGLMPPTPSWGELLAQAQKNFTVAWWLALYPSLALFFTLTMMNFIGEGVRDAVDPYQN